jgi:glycerophosphodiester phosphodiesterase
LRAGVHNPKLVVVGHRGCGKNKSLSQGEAIDSRPSIRENTIASFNQAARNGADYVEFDVQVTKDRHAIIFHDDYIIIEDKVPRKIGDITLEEFLGIGPQKNFAKEGRSLYRKARDGTLNRWTATMEDPLCTLEEAFKQVDPSVGFNIEVKFDDIDETSDVELQRVIYPIVESVRQHSNGRRIYFSSFHPDAVHLLGSLQSTYPVFFLTDGGGRIYNDERRNSIQAAIAVCQQGQLQGIVTEVQAVLHEPSLISLIKAANLWVFTYGEFNNVEEAVRKQKDAGVDGVIVDHVLEIVKLEHQLEDQQPPISSSYSTTSSRTASLPVF